MANSNQDIETPWPFIKAVERYLGLTFSYDMAATNANKKAAICFTKENDALSIDWPLDGWCWVNPPFRYLSDWIRKCKEQMDRGCRIVTIWPLSGDQNQITTWKNCSVHIVHGRVWLEVRSWMLCVWDKVAIDSIKIAGLFWDDEKLTDVWSA